MVRNTYHRDGTVTYWSVYQQQWVRHAMNVPAKELAAMSSRVRKKVINHLLSGNRYCPIAWDDNTKSWYYDENMLGVDEKCFCA